MEHDNPFTTSFVSGLGPEAGTSAQTVIIEEYPYETFQDKLKIPYIERYNGNIAVREGDILKGLKHYSKALMGLKMIFDGNKNDFLNSREDAVKYIAEIEIPCCLNLAHCYLKQGDWHYAIKYSSQVIDNDANNVKGFYRRGVAYTKIGEITRAKDDLARALELTTDPAEKQAIQAAF